jgi:hypothetical protein
MNENLMQAVVEAAVFVGTADEDTVDEDAAVEQLEQMAYFLKRLSAEEQREFVDFVKRHADEAAQRGSAERAEFLRSLPSNLGL